MRLILLFISLLSCLPGNSQSVLEGTARDTLTNRILPGARITVYVIDSIRLVKQQEWYTVNENNGSEYYPDTVYKKLQRVFADSSGNYFVTGLQAGFYKISAFYQTGEIPGKGIYGEYDYLYTTVDCDSRITWNARIPVTCPYDLTRNLTHCPKCHQKDEILKIVNGLFNIGDIKPGYYHTGYCIVERCTPTWICTRCDYQF